MDRPLRLRENRGFSELHGPRVPAKCRRHVKLLSHVSRMLSRLKREVGISRDAVVKSGLIPLRENLLVFLKLCKFSPDEVTIGTVDPLMGASGTPVFYV